MSKMLVYPMSPNISIVTLVVGLVIMLLVLADVMRINGGNYMSKAKVTDSNLVVVRQRLMEYQPDSVSRRRANDREKNQLDRPARLAIVQVMAPGTNGGRREEYIASIYGVNGRIRGMHADKLTLPYDHVVMICDIDDPTGVLSSHPLITVVLYDCTAIRSTVEPHKVWVETFYIVAAMSLTQYDKVLVIDADTVLLTPVDKMMREMPAPAMTLWGSFGSKCDYNSGAVLLKPSKSMYDDALTMMDDIEIGRERRLMLQRQTLTNQERGPMPPTNLSSAQVSTDYSDQEFLTTFWEYSRYALKHGPLYVLSHKYNMRFQDLADFDKIFMQYQQTHDPTTFQQVSKGPRWSSAMLCLFGGYCNHSIPHTNNDGQATQQYHWNGPSIIHLTPNGKIRKPWPKCSLTHYTMFMAAINTYTITKVMAKAKQGQPFGKFWEADEALVNIAKEFCNITLPL